MKRKVGHEGCTMFFGGAEAGRLVLFAATVVLRSFELPAGRHVARLWGGIAASVVHGGDHTRYANRGTGRI